MKIRFEFRDGKLETYDLKDVTVKSSEGETNLLECETNFEARIDHALIFGGIFEVPRPPLGSLIEKVKILSHSLKKVVLLKEDEQKPAK